MAIQKRSTDTARGRASWLEAGAGWPVILLHAFPLNAAMWGPQLEHVPQGWRFIAPDLRRAGPSTMDDYAADVFAVMDALEIESAVIGGLSMGGYVAFAMFRLAPARFTAMILADTRAAADTPQGREGRVAMRALLGEKGTSGVATVLLPKLLSPAAGSGLVDRVRAVIESMPAEAVDAAIGAMMDRPDSTPDLAQVTCAALVAVGKDDVITPVADAEAVQRELRRSTLCVIPDAGHLSNLEQPDAFSRALGDFLLSAL